MRISDWSSDVCSSDLLHRAGGAHQAHQVERRLVVQLAGVTEDDKRIAPVVGARIGRDQIERCRHRKVHPLCVIGDRSEEHTSELQSLMRNSYAVFCLKKKNTSERY